MSISRRSALAAGMGLVISPASRLARSQTAPKQSSYHDKAAMDAWMQGWMNAPHASSEALHLGRFADRRYWLLKQIRWTPNPGQNASPVTVPPGFVTDFASIPPVFWSVLPPDGQYTYPAIIHDFLYWEQKVSIEEADRVLKYAMGDFKVDAASSVAINTGVKLGGPNAWSENALLKAKGEKRILKKYPDDPTMTWAIWKEQPGSL